ncbi:hypothetical protein PALB_18840 [Pseudoalteromonas luteoviolacea B = ATCC 29581]|nr:hypothetical protein PALB_18840 [Pseudoalteromonas luteoviolacea B = ATCC 29581]
MADFAHYNLILNENVPVMPDTQSALRFILCASAMSKFVSLAHGVKMSLY